MGGVLSFAAPILKGICQYGPSVIDGLSMIERKLNDPKDLTNDIVRIETKVYLKLYQDLQSFIDVAEQDLKHHSYRPIALNEVITELSVSQLSSFGEDTSKKYDRLKKILSKIHVPVQSLCAMFNVIPSVYSESKLINYIISAVDHPSIQGGIMDLSSATDWSVISRAEKERKIIALKKIKDLLDILSDTKELTFGNSYFLDPKTIYYTSDYSWYITEEGKFQMSEYGYALFKKLNKIYDITFVVHNYQLDWRVKSINITDFGVLKNNEGPARFPYVESQYYGTVELSESLVQNISPITCILKPKVLKLDLTGPYLSNFRDGLKMYDDFEPLRFERVVENIIKISTSDICEDLYSFYKWIDLSIEYFKLDRNKVMLLLDPNNDYISFFSLPFVSHVLGRYRLFPEEIKKRSKSWSYMMEVYSEVFDKIEHCPIALDTNEVDDVSPATHMTNFI